MLMTTTAKLGGAVKLPRVELKMLMMRRKERKNEITITT